MEIIPKARQLIGAADLVIATAGNSFAKIEGLDLLDQSDFDQNFPALAQKYGVHSVGKALDLKLKSWPEQWLLWSALINKYSLAYQPSPTMRELRQLLEKKEYFIATSTFGHFFEQAGFNDKRIFNVFGDWTMTQCSSGINHGLVDDRTTVQKIVQKTTDEGNAEDIAGLVPKCAACSQPLELHMPLNGHFYPDTDANTRFRWFLTGNEDKKVAFLELGVDETSPQLREPIIHLVEQFPLWSYIAADLEQTALPLAIRERSAATGIGSAPLVHELVAE